MVRERERVLARGGYFAVRGLLSHAAFLLHQAAERYFHAALLVFTGYKPKTHDIERLAKETAELHAELAGALPRAEEEDERLFKLLKRSYIDARYSKSFRITREEFGVLSERVQDLGARVRAAGAEKLATFCGAEAVGKLSEVPTAEEVGELPEAPPLDDAEGVARWAEAIAARSFEQGEARGEARGRQEERARAIVDVLRRRGVAVSDEEEVQILACREEAKLALWWERAWSAVSAAEVLEVSGAAQDRSALSANRSDRQP